MMMTAAADPPDATRILKRVAIIGGGAAGIAALKNITSPSPSSKPTKIDLQPTLFERNPQLGGTWIHTPTTNPDLDPSSPPKPSNLSAVYDNLHTNLTPELMQFLDQPFPEGTEMFPTHTVILSYLQTYARLNNLERYVKFQTTVLDVVWEGSCWRVTYTTPNGRQEVEEFEAVIVASGHYYKPYVPPISTLSLFKGRMIHSRDYRNPASFSSKRVLVVGGGSSGIDIAREISTVADKVWLSVRKPGDVGDLGETLEVLGLDKKSGGVEKKPEIRRIMEDGEGVEFVDDSTVAVDCVVFCTGYLFDFPFLPQLTENNKSLPSEQVLLTDGRGVHNIYKYLFYIPNPTLSFIGLPFKIDPFPLFFYQAAVITAFLRSQFVLPSAEKMREEEKEEEDKLGVKSGSREKLVMGYVRQFEFWDWCASVTGLKATEEGRVEMRQGVLGVRRKFFGY
ncbi:hypothetical protein HDV05_006842 [Chytridiales sp. JEL 0842]|nr:hypothetical protein HDV05_006842 [Chytridiales sp. JEL 0842]